jgi:hypothetical protein
MLFQHSSQEDTRRVSRPSKTFTSPLLENIRNERSWQHSSVSHHSLETIIEEDDFESPPKKTKTQASSQNTIIESPTSTSPPIDTTFNWTKSTSTKESLKAIPAELLIPKLQKKSPQSSLASSVNSVEDFFNTPASSDEDDIPLLSIIKKSPTRPQAKKNEQKPKPANAYKPPQPSKPNKTTSSKNGLSSNSEYEDSSSETATTLKNSFSKPRGGLHPRKEQQGW